MKRNAEWRKPSGAGLLCIVLSAAVCGCEKETAGPAATPPVDAPTPPGAAVPAPAPAVITTNGERGFVHPPITQPPHGTATERPNTPPVDPHAELRESMPPPAPMRDPHSATGSGRPAENPTPEVTELDGLRFRVPKGWIAEAPDKNAAMPQFAPKAVFRLPPAEDDEEPAYLRITHFPEMKGKDEVNLERWYSQFTQPDGRPTREVARVEEFDVGEIKVLVADITGTTAVAGTPKDNQRMLSAILNHPRGPHFVRVLGPEKTVERWRESVMEYLRSAELQSGAETGN